jgi:hypothetical protein
MSLPVNISKKKDKKSRNSIKSSSKKSRNSISKRKTKSNTRKKRKLRSYRRQRKRSGCKPLCKKNKGKPGYDCGECLLAASKNICKVVNKFSFKTGRFEQYCRPLKNTKHDT